MHVEVFIKIDCYTEEHILVVFVIVDHYKDLQEKKFYFTVGKKILNKTQNYSNKNIIENVLVKFF